MVEDIDVTIDSDVEEGVVRLTQYSIDRPITEIYSTKIINDKIGELVNLIESEIKKQSGREN